VTSDHKERAPLRVDIITLRLEGVVYVALSCAAMSLLPSTAARLGVGLLCAAYLGLLAVRYWRAGKAGAGVTRQNLAGVMYVALGCTAIWLLPFLVNLLAAGVLTLVYLGLTAGGNWRARKQSDRGEYRGLGGGQRRYPRPHA
jgi:hypothetical protein